MTKLTKQTATDVAQQMMDLCFTGKVDGGYIADYDEEYVYVRTHDEDLVPKYYRMPYKKVEREVIIDKTMKQRVSKETEYKVMSESGSEDEIKKELSALRKIIEFTMKGDEDTSNVIKQFDEETMTVHEPLYIGYGEVDGHGDTYYNKESIDSLVKELLKSNEEGVLQTSYFHKMKTDSFSIEDAYIAPKGSTVGETAINSDQPVAIIKFHSDKAFKARMEGQLTGLSIGAKGSVELVKESSSKGPNKVKGALRYIKTFDFSHKNAHLTYTDPSVGGAASLKNEPYLVKDMNGDSLNAAQTSLLEDVLEEEFVPLDKKLASGDTDKDTPSTSDISEEVNSGVDNINNTIGNKMSEKQDPKVEALEKQVAAMKLEKALNKYGLASEVVEGLSSALVELSEDNQEAVTKSLDALVESAEAKLEGLKKELDSEDNSAEENPLVKDLGKEHGSAGEAELKKEKNLTLAERVSLANKEKQSS